MRKNSRISILSILLGLFIGLLAGCGSVAVAGGLHMSELEHQSSFSLRLSDAIEIWRDDETGVEYFIIYDNESMNAMCPRYNTDGTLYIYEE